MLPEALLARLRESAAAIRPFDAAPEREPERARARRCVDDVLQAVERDPSLSANAETALMDAWHAALLVLPDALRYGHLARQVLLHAVGEGAAVARAPARRVMPPLNVVLVEPEIPQNTGSVARTCAATGSSLHLVQPLGFSVDDKQVKRAGLDYWDSVTLHSWGDWQSYREAAAEPVRRWYFSGFGERAHTDARYLPGDHLVFGCETRGLSWQILAAEPERVCTIPMANSRAVRSLNLSNAVAIVLYEALRQVGGCELLEPKSTEEA